MRPRFRPQYHVRIWPPDTVVLFWESSYRRLDGRLTATLAPYLNGRYTTTQIVEELQGTLTALDVWYGIDELREAGYLVPEDSLPLPSVQVYATAGLEPKSLEVVLRTLGIRTGSEAVLDIVLIDHPLQQELQPFHQSSRPWTMVKHIGSVIAFGPIFHKGRPGCWRCLTMRLRESPETQALFPLHGERYSRSERPVVRDAGLNLAALEVEKWLAGISVEIENTLFTLDTESMILHRHILTPREDCPDCGPLPAAHQTPLPPDPDAVYELYRHHISSLTGVVHTLEPLPNGGADVFPVFGAGHNFTLDAGRLVPPDRLGALSRGKGVNIAQARTSALCEALERYSGVYRGNEPKRRARMEDLGDQAIDPRSLMNFSAAQYRLRRADEPDPKRWVPQPFDPQREIDWTPVWSITQKQTKYVPTACCWYAFPPDPQRDFARADSNGCAAGSTMEDAIQRGFLELIERDAFAIWWYNRIRRPAVNLESIGEPAIERLVEHYRKQGRTIWALDITTDFDIPAVIAISLGVDGDKPLLMGAGANPDRGKASISALAEMNQGYGLSLESEATAYSAEEFLYPATDAQTRKPVIKPEPQILVLNQTRRDVNLPVVRVIVPGLRHFWPRFAPGRLYEVPVKLGWLTEAVNEVSLNPSLPTV